MQTSENLNELFAAVSRVQGKLKTVIKTADNPFFKSKYAKLSDFWNEVRPLLAEEGLCVVTGVADTEGPILIEGEDKDGPYKENGVKVSIDVMLGHSSGQYVHTNASTFVQGMGPQQVGSSVEYLRRYTLASLLGMASDDDDDGEAAQGRPKSFAPQNGVKTGGKTDVKAVGSDPAPFKKVTAEVQRLKWPAEQVKAYLLNNFKKDKIGLLTVGECETAYKFLSDIKPTETRKED